MTESRWDYWCPHGGTHVIAPNELHVGIVSGDRAWVFAVVPPLPTDHPRQNEAAARIIKDALAAGPWLNKDGIAAGYAGDGLYIDWPKPTHALSDPSPSGAIPPAESSTLVPNSTPSDGS